MAHDTDDSTIVRQYLLGQIADDELPVFETRFLIEAELLEALEVSEDELIHDYVAGELSPTERKAFEQNFVATPERRKKYRFARALKKHVSTPKSIVINTPPDVVPPKNWRFWQPFAPQWALAASVLIVVGVGFAAWRILSYQSPVDKGLVALNSAYKNQRPLEARISRFDYAPFGTIRGTGKSEVDDAELRRAELTFLDALNNRPTPAVRHGLGKVYLTKKDFDRAIEQFELALKEDPNNASIYADLGAAFLEKGKQESVAGGETDRSAGQGFLNIARGVENLDRALQLNNGLLEARYNRALAHEYLSLTVQAANDWREYLKKDQTSPWADEARQHLQVLENSNKSKSSLKVLEDFMAAYQQRNDEKAWRILSQTREMITGVMIPLQLTREVVRTPQQNRDEASLSALRYAGELELQHARDPFFSELAHYYASISAAQEESLGLAQGATDAGYKSCLAGKFDHALDQFEQARTGFDAGQNSWEARLTDYWIAYCFSRTGKLSESTKLLQELAHYSDARGYKWLLMQALSWNANNDNLQRDYSEALALDTRALLTAREISDTYMQQKVLAQLALEYLNLAAPGRALSYIQQALSLTDLYYTSPRQQWRNYNFAADILFDQETFSAAADYGRESLRLARDEFADPTTIHNSLVRLGRLYGGLRNFPEAIDAAKQSLEVSQSLPAGRASQTMAAFSQLQLGHLERLAGDYRSALSHYDEAVRFYEPDADTGFSVNYYDSRKGSLACYVELNENQAVEKELPSVLSLFEEHRATILEEENRNTFFDREQSVYDTAIAYAYSQQQTELAFDYSERSRARSLLDTFHNNAKLANSASGPQMVFSAVASPLKLSEISTRLPAGVQLVQYAVLPDKLLIWVVSPSEFKVVEQPIANAALHSLVTDFMQLLASGSGLHEAEMRKLAVKLYDVLVKPIEPLLQLQNVICIVPDKYLSQLPFAALISSDTQNYLVSTHCFLYAPSSNVFILSTDVARKKATGASERILTVGNPSFDKKAYRDLSDLPPATREARTIAGFYQKASQLVGPEADKASFARELDRADVIHFAGHYLPNETSPLESKLLLAWRDGGDDGVFTVREIVERRFTRPRLIVLSACRTEMDRYYNGEGAIGVSRGFLGAGIPLVVASQWPVDSEATAQLMIAFHRYRTEPGVTTTVALQRAQRDLLNNPENPRFHDPYYWAAFMALGAYTSF